MLGYDVRVVRRPGEKIRVAAEIWGLTGAQVKRVGIVHTSGVVVETEEDASRAVAALEGAMRMIGLPRRSDTELG